MSVLLWIGVVLSIGAAVQPPDTAEPGQLRQGLLALLRQAHQLGPWREHHKLIVEAARSIWQRNGWTSEPDQFARKVLERVSKYPPWQLDERFDALCEALAERYQLDQQQRRRLNQIVVREVWLLFGRHSREVMQIGKEMLRSRLAGRAFTPEQVARWSKLAEPITEDIRRSVDAAAAEFGRSLRPEQRARLQRDLVAYHLRLKRYGVLLKRWAGGQWKPADWGLEHDPIHAVQMGVGPAGQVPPAERHEQTVGSAGADAWQRYVERFIARYQLEDSQQVTALSILEELRTRAAACRRGSCDRAAVQAAIRRLFEELKRRLEEIPTSAQRARATGATAR